eukprot:7754354-Alexandrium_andersonii.AAC.1
MSASLVGSEMCIRDSPGWERAGWRDHRGPPHGRNHARRDDLAPPKGQAPVSYTHLTLPTICSV